MVELFDLSAPVLYLSDLACFPLGQLLPACSWVQQTL